ncbi:MAG: glycosyl hydrolase [Litorilinea sp.]|nr:MAG: glycosyl hydrolase [Litorilinea sp.]
MAEFWAFLWSWQGQQWGILAYLAVLLANALLNVLTLPRLGRSPQAGNEPGAWPTVSLLVPARNEEATIERCVRSLLAQDYPAFDLWVLDDNSTDRTPAILARLAGQDARLQVRRGTPPPAGWLGKPWACHQLAQHATGQVLLFVDADTWHEPAMVRAVVGTLLHHQADLLSALPRQHVESWAERLTVPLIPWCLLTHFPLWAARWTGGRRFAVGVGQVLAMPRASYRRLGGHAGVRQQVTEDMALAQRVARGGGRWLLCDGTGVAHCRMYRTPAQVWEGFGRNLYAVFGGHLPLYLFVWLWLTLVLMGPWVALALGEARGFSPPLALLALAIQAGTWALTLWRLNLPPRLLGLFPLVHGAMVLVAFHSLGQGLTRRTRWKGRAVHVPP